MAARNRQAGAHPFSGIYAFEVFRSVVGDDAAERILRTKYDLDDRATGCADIGKCGVDLAERDRRRAGS